MNKTWLSTMLSVIFVLLGTIAAKAADRENGISAPGKSVVEVDPERMRLKVEVSFKGKSLAEALAKVKVRKPELEKQLLSLGAIKESIKLDEPVMDESQNPQHAHLARMMMNRMQGRRGQKPVEEPLKRAAVKVRAELTAEWPLKFANRADLLVQVAKLQEAIKDADLVGLKNTEKEEDDEEQEEVNDEMEAMQEMVDYSNQNQPKPGEPAFLFVSQISVSQREKALAEAFRNAKEQAAGLAKAADLELGPVRSLEIDVMNGMDDDDVGHFAYPSFYRNRTTSHDDEASSPIATTLKKRLYVQATFSITAKQVAAGASEKSKP